MNHTIDRAEKVNSRAALIACGLEDPTTALGRVARSSLFDRRLVGEIWSFAEPKRIRVGNDPFCLLQLTENTFTPSSGANFIREFARSAYLPVKP